MQKIKVLHVVHDFLYGGIESYLYYLVQAQLLNPALEVAILCCQAEDKVANPRIKALALPIYYVPIKAFDLGIHKYRKVREIASAYAVVQLHIFKPLLLEALSGSGASMLFTVHTAGAVRREQSLYGKLKVRLQVMQLNRRCQAVVNNSRYSQQYWKDKGLRESNNVVIYNGVRFPDPVDASAVYAAYPALKGKFVVGTSSRFIGWKRVDYLLRSFAKLHAVQPQALLLLVGDGPEMGRLQQLKEELNLGDAVLFVGFQKQVTAFQSVMDVCVFPSASEPFGLVAIECMHLGKPVLVLEDGGGLAELVAQVEPAMVVADVEQLTDALVKIALQKEPEDAQRLHNRIAFAENFNVHAIEQEYAHYYKTLIADA